MQVLPAAHFVPPAQPAPPHCPYIGTVPPLLALLVVAGGLADVVVGLLTAVVVVEVPATEVGVPLVDVVTLYTAISWLANVIEILVPVPVLPL